MVRPTNHVIARVGVPSTLGIFCNTFLQNIDEKQTKY